jgi:hypothetical protein
MSALLTTEELCEWFECKQPAKLARLLKEQNINYKLNAAGQPITTYEAVNDSLKNKEHDSEVDFD